MCSYVNLKNMLFCVDLIKASLIIQLLVYNWVIQLIAYKASITRPNSICTYFNLKNMLFCVDLIKFSLIIQLLVYNWVIQLIEYKASITRPNSICSYVDLLKKSILCWPYNSFLHNTISCSHLSNPIEKVVLNCQYHKTNE